MLQKFLKEEEEARISALREEKNQKSEMMKTESEAFSREITDLSDTIRVADDVLQAEDISFLQSYNTTAELVQNFQLDVPQKTPEALIDEDKHLNNLSFKILDSIKKKVSPTQPPKPYHKPLQPYNKPPLPPAPRPAPKTSKATLVEGLKRQNVELMNKNRYKETGLFGTSQGGAVSRKPLNREPPSCNTRVISKKNPVPRSYDPRYQGFAFPPTASSYYFGYPYDIPPLPQLPTLPTLPTSYYSSNTGYSPWR